MSEQDREREDRYVAQAHQEVATRNSRVAVKVALESKHTTEERVRGLEVMVSALVQQVTSLNEKYNLLLSERFKSGPTSR